ncbi:MAG: transglutaminase family protein [Saprospiraceae bacterium]|nr:transglutaminase family protein [Saprospiraceae bacterium]
MRLKVGCQLEYLSRYDTPLILLLRLHRVVSQTVIHENLTVYPDVPMTEYTDHYGNYCHRLIAPEGRLVISAHAIVETALEAEVDTNANFTLIQYLPDDTLIYLLPSRFCESDKLNSKAYEIINDGMTGYQMVEAIRQWVFSNIKYEYNRSTSSTSALDTLSVQHGVCRDMSHLAIALCRSINIPARFVTGYLYDLKPMDLHAWFEAFLDDKWYTFDATQPFVTGGRVTLAYGRDAADVATATYFGDIVLENMFVFVEQE